MKSKVAVLFTSPESVKQDISKAMEIAGYKEYLNKDIGTILKINISWQYYYPACSTTPWQLDGVIETLKADNFSNVIPTHNGTVVVDAKEGAINNKHLNVEKKHIDYIIKRIDRSYEKIYQFVLTLDKYSLK